MAWEDRPGGRYYYRKKRVGRRVISEYIGAGPLADLVSMQDRHRAAERKEAREEGRPADDNPELDALLAQLAGNVETLTRAYLLATGHHPHKGQWRKTRCP